MIKCYSRHLKTKQSQIFYNELLIQQHTLLPFLQLVTTVLFLQARKLHKMHVCKSHLSSFTFKLVNSFTICTNMTIYYATGLLLFMFFSLSLRNICFLITCKIFKVPCTYVTHAANGKQPACKLFFKHIQPLSCFHFISSQVMHIKLEVE